MGAADDIYNDVYDEWERNMPMPQYDESNRGVLFPEREKKGERYPDYTGKIDVEGKVYRLAAWTKAKGVLSIAVSEFKAERDAPTSTGGDLDSEVPF